VSTFCDGVVEGGEFVLGGKWGVKWAFGGDIDEIGARLVFWMYSIASFMFRGL